MNVMNYHYVKHLKDTKIFTGNCAWLVCFLHHDFLCFCVDFYGDCSWHGHDSHDPFKKDDKNVRMTKMHTEHDASSVHAFTNTYTPDLWRQNMKMKLRNKW